MIDGFLPHFLDSWPSPNVDWIFVFLEICIFIFLHFSLYLVFLEIVFFR